MLRATLLCESEVQAEGHDPERLLHVLQEKSFTAFCKMQLPTSHISLAIATFR